MASSSGSIVWRRAFDLLDAPLELADGGDLGRGVAALLLDLADGAAGLVALPLELLGLAEGGAPFGVEQQPGVERRRVRIAVEKALADLFGIVAEEVSGKHDAGVYLTPQRSTPL